MRWFIRILVLCALAAGGYYAWQWKQRDERPEAPTYRTVAVKRMDIVPTITATGTIVPEDVVDVGAQVNGPIASLGLDRDGKQVDYRSIVEVGSVLAKLDETVYAADVAAGVAQMAQAEAQLKVAEANRVQAQARLDQSLRDWERAQKLGQSRALSAADFDAAKSGWEQAQAGVAVADASIAQARAAIATADASLMRSRRNLAYCTIRSPVDGVIIDRKVDVGQTVVSSLNAPSLFLIAKDLRRMQVLVQVNEADIGHVQPGAKVTFTTDTFPNETFTGEVRKIRLNATMTQNVVTYTVEIVTDNANLRLLPYLTANVRFVIDRRQDVLAVPNAALRWSPPATGAPDSAGAANGRGEGRRQDGAASRPRRAPRSTVWVFLDGALRSVAVKTGLSDGSVTEVEADDLQEGDDVVVGENTGEGSGAAQPQTTNPFSPPMFRGGRR